MKGAAALLRKAVQLIDILAAKVEGILGTLIRPGTDSHAEAGRQSAEELYLFLQQFGSFASRSCPSAAAAMLTEKLLADYMISKQEKRPAKEELQRDAYGLLVALLQQLKDCIKDLQLGIKSFETLADADTTGSLYLLISLRNFCTSCTLGVRSPPCIHSLDSPGQVGQVVNPYDMHTAFICCMLLSQLYGLQPIHSCPVSAGRQHD